MNEFSWRKNIKRRNRQDVTDFLKESPPLTTDAVKLPPSAFLNTLRAARVSVTYNTGFSSIG
jgi:hypothetical protein